MGLVCATFLEWAVCCGATSTQKWREIENLAHHYDGQIIVFCCRESLSFSCIFYQLSTNSKEDFLSQCSLSGPTAKFCHGCLCGLCKATWITLEIKLVFEDTDQTSCARSA